MSLRGDHPGVRRPNRTEEITTGTPVADPGLQWDLRPTRWAAVGLTAAGALHLVAAPSYLGHDVRFFVLSFAVGTMQILTGPRLWRQVRARSGVSLVAVTATLLLLDMPSRSVGLPLGPHVHESWGSDLLGLALVGCELATVAGIAVSLPPRARSWTANVLAVVAAGVWALWVTSTFI